MQCCYTNEGEKPSPRMVRASRKSIFDAVSRGAGLASELSKAFVSFEVGKVAMGKAKLFAAIGLEDEAATLGFETSMQSFDRTFSAAYDDVLVWIGMSNDGVEQDINSISKLIPAIAELRAAVVCATGRWSPSGLQEHVGHAVTAIGNAADILHVALYVMLHSSRSRLLDPLKSLSGCRVDTLGSCITAETDGGEPSGSGGSDGTKRLGPLATFSPEVLAKMRALSKEVVSFMAEAVGLATSLKENASGLAGCVKLREGRVAVGKTSLSVT
jgi:hypothetical protein